MTQRTSLTIVVAFLLFVIIYLAERSTNSTSAAEQSPIFVVLMPFEILEGGPATLADAISEKLAALLDDDPRFAIVSEQRLKSILESNGDRERHATEQSVAFLVKGSVYAEAKRRFVALRIEDVLDGDTLWFENYDYTNINAEMLASYVFDNLAKAAD